MRFEYVEENGKKYLVVKKNTQETIDIVTQKMMDNNTIEGILPCSINQMNDQVEFRYDISVYESAKDYYKSVLNKSSVMKFLKSIIHICEICEKYLIDANQILMDPKYIYVNRRTKEIVYVILPIEDMNLEFFEELKGLVLDFTLDPKENMEYFAQVIKYFRTESTFSLYDFSNMVQYAEKIADDMSHSGLKSREVNVNKGNGTTGKTLIKTETSESEEETEEELPKKGIAKILSKIRKEDISAKDTKNSHFGGDVAIPGTDQRELESAVKDSIGIKTVSISGTNIENSGEEGIKEIPKGFATYGVFSIVRVSTGERYPIQLSTSRIGRQKSKVDICILGNDSVGREHAFLYLDQNSLSIQDNNSLNGTALMNITNKIDAGKRYILFKGDRFFLGSEEFVVE